MTQLQNQPAATSVPTFTPLLSDREVADLLVVTIAWVRSHAGEIPGLKRLGSYLRFCTNEIEHWLGSLDQVLEADTVATLMRVPQSWIYANADEIPGVLRLGRYVRFRPAVIRSFLSGSEVVQ